MDYTIRNAQSADLDALEELEKLCFSLPWTRRQLASELPDAQHEFLVADAGGGEILGYIGMMCVLDEGYISNVAVSPQVRRMGIGRALVAQMLECCTQRELSFATLEVRAHNDAAIALYEDAGFRSVGLRKGYYERPREDALLMTRFFEKESER